MFERIRISQGKRGQVRCGDVNYCEVEFAVPGMDLGRGETFAVRKLNFDGAAFANDMQAGGDQAIAGDDEAGADAIFFSISIEVGNDDDGLFDALGQSFDGSRRRFGFWGRVSNCAAIGGGSAEKCGQ